MINCCDIINCAIIIHDTHQWALQASNSTRYYPFQNSNDALLVPIDSNGLVFSRTTAQARFWSRPV